MASYIYCVITNNKTAIIFASNCCFYALYSFTVPTFVLYSLGHLALISSRLNIDLT